MLAAVVSDTHGRIDDVVKVLKKYTLDALFFLGDLYEDGTKICEALPQKVPLFAVVGNGDATLAITEPAECTTTLGCKTFFSTHGHLYQVKKGLDQLVTKGEAEKADVVMFGHTHIPFLAQNSRGMWVLNPGSASFPRGVEDATFALLEWEENQPITCMMMEVESGRLLYSSLDL